MGSLRVRAGLDLVFELVARDMRTSATIYFSQQTLRAYGLARFHVAMSSDVGTSAKRSEFVAYRGFALLMPVDVTPFRCMLG